MPRELLNMKQVEDYLGLSERSILRLLKQQKLKGFKVGREWRFEQRDVDEYIDTQRKEAERQRQAKREEIPV